MGWWYSTAEGESLQPSDTGIIWGDEPADVMDAALDKIADMFIKEWGRPPCEAELMAGIRFSTAPPIPSL